MSAEYVIPVPLQSRPTLRVGNVPSHGRTPREVYRLPRAWCLHAYRYRAELYVDQHALEIQPGNVGIIPANVDIEFRFQQWPSVHAYVHYTVESGGETALIPAMQPMGLRFEGFFADMQKIITTLSSNRLRAEVLLWDLLWELADRYAERAPEGVSPAVTRAMQMIELGLAGDLRVERLAAETGLSHNHLTRLFRRATGMTIVQYIRRRRVERARQLLQGSSRTIKSIAAEIGVPDLQHFNKLIRQELGVSPRMVRG